MLLRTKNSIQPRALPHYPPIRKRILRMRISGREKRSGFQLLIQVSGVDS